MFRIVVAFGLLVASGHAANPQHVDNLKTASEVEAVKAKLHEQVLHAAEAEKDEPRATGATVWREKKRRDNDETMDAAVYVGKKDWAWNAGKKEYVAKKDAKDHESTSADVDAYRNHVHKNVVKANTEDVVHRSSTKWKMPAGGLDAAADRKSQDWAWGGGASALQASSAAFRGSAVSQVHSGSSQKWQRAKTGRFTKNGQSIFAAVAAPHVPKLPEQGYEGKGVKHMNMKTISSDWGTEYGPTTQKPLSHSACGAMTVSFVAALAAVAAF